MPRRLVINLDTEDKNGEPLYIVGKYGNTTKLGNYSGMDAYTCTEFGLESREVVSTTPRALATFQPRAIPDLSSSPATATGSPSCTRECLEECTTTSRTLRPFGGFSSSSSRDIPLPSSTAWSTPSSEREHHLSSVVIVPPTVLSPRLLFVFISFLRSAFFYLLLVSRWFRRVP